MGRSIGPSSPFCLSLFDALVPHLTHSPTRSYSSVCNSHSTFLVTSSHGGAHAPSTAPFAWSMCPLGPPIGSRASWTSSGSLLHIIFTRDVNGYPDTRCRAITRAVKLRTGSRVYGCQRVPYSWASRGVMLGKLTEWEQANQARDERQVTSVAAVSAVVSLWY